MPTHYDQISAKADLFTYPTEIRLAAWAIANPEQYQALLNHMNEGIAIMVAAGLIVLD